MDPIRWPRAELEAMLRAGGQGTHLVETPSPAHAKRLRGALYKRRLALGWEYDTIITQEERFLRIRPAETKLVVRGAAQ